MRSSDLLRSSNSAVLPSICLAVEQYSGLALCWSSWSKSGTVATCGPAVYLPLKRAQAWEFFISVPETSDSPLYPGFAAVLCEAGVGQAHVEEGRKHEGEEGDRGSAHQVQDGPEAAHARARSSFFEDQNQTKPVFF